MCEQLERFHTALSLVAPFRRTIEPRGETECRAIRSESALALRFSIVTF